MSHHHQSCSGEAHQHDHGHDHGHDHDHDGPDRGEEVTLFSQIDLDSVRCLNEATQGSARKVFRPWHQRFDESEYIESDADEQLIIFIPFTGSVKLKSIALLGFNDATAPSNMKVFINRQDIDFDSVESTGCQQEWDLIETVPRNSIPEYPTRMAKFANVRNLTLFIPTNFGGSGMTRIRYIGLKGEWTPINKDPIITIYELAANPADHKTKTGGTTNHNMIQ
ncbi:hypothetical protein BASA50_009965 [Batrachochytrium salamandrivorans]|uniref:PITH domain-containing protein n=1 Tax=Batrachochytrium salamandrivorans TaxID=1357716 RepID=A0ABQ8EZU1_9FUNG|nr:hypothetical protein BASA62_003636 [Batrachochytrium salamandrivorans]KAH6576958.1 hypothetical protein BASA60_004301 [Batrachochytrium salamandrivorans]KAH6589554.1 hypothetical protein BASA50_009965 [Batrachochytrium salamandrivorans]KAH6600545.1 hypothetical protein BASA61_002255 [Batrachochytrium salamandrivorans]KAH9246160.1 hypothetical protein BASA81_016301 [Batrachochytrium salamandrivorans]